MNESQRSCSRFRERWFSSSHCRHILRGLPLVAIKGHLPQPGQASASLFAIRLRLSRSFISSFKQSLQQKRRGLPLLRDLGKDRLHFGFLHTDIVVNSTMILPFLAIGILLQLPNGARQGREKRIAPMASMKELIEKNESLKSRAESMTKKAERGMHVFLGAAVAGATGFALGYMAAENDDNPGHQPTYGDTKEGANDGVKLSTIVAGLSFTAQIMTKKESMSRHFGAMGHSALGVTAYEFGQEKAKEWDDDEAADKTTGRRRVRRAGQQIRGAIEYAGNAGHGSGDRMAQYARQHTGLGSA